MLKNYQSREDRERLKKMILRLEAEEMKPEKTRFQGVEEAEN